MSIIDLSIGFFLGIISYFTYTLLSNYFSLKKVKDEYKSVFNEVKKTIGEKSMIFVSRVNQNAIFKVRTKSFGTFDMVLFLDKNQIHLIRDQNLIYASNLPSVGVKLVQDIIEDIYSKYNDMSNVISMGGVLIDKKTYNRMTNNLGIQGSIIDGSNFQDDNITNDTILTLDTILDKINEVGLDGLTTEEKSFLENHSNGNS